MEQRKILGVKVVIWSLLSVLIQIPYVMGDEVTDGVIDKSTTEERRGCGDTTPCGMENYRFKTDLSKDDYFDIAKNTGAYQEWQGLPRSIGNNAFSGVSEIVCLLPDNVDLEYVKYVFDKAIYDNYCPSGTEKGIAVTFLFVKSERLDNLIDQYYEKTGVVPTIENEDFLEYITTELREEKVGVVTKLLLESDSSHERDVRKFQQFRKNLLIGYLTAFRNRAIQQGMQQGDVITCSIECFLGLPNSFFESKS